jgi:signal peptide peptidase SppA
MGIFGFGKKNASASTKKRDYPHLAGCLYGIPLAITPEKLATIVDAFEMHRAGTMTEEEIVRRVGMYFDPDDEDAEDSPGYTTTQDGIAVLPIQGTISQRLSGMQQHSGGASTERIGADFDDAMQDPAVKGVVLNVDSPGGSIHGVAELANKVFQARGKKPITAVANSQMSSAAYWIASSADKIVASPSSLVGSIGVITVHRESSKSDEARGAKYTVVSAGQHKADGNPYEPLTEQSRATLDQLVGSVYDQFVGSVARNRSTTADAVKGGYGQGKSLLGQEAVSAGLADRVATLEDVLDEMGATARAKTSASRPTGIFGSDPAPPPSVLSPTLPSKTSPAMSVSAKLKGAAVARGLVADAADDANTETAIKAFFVAKGEPLPTDEAIAIAALAPPKADSAEQKIRAAAAAEERTRIAEIQARGKMLGIEAASIQASIDAGDAVGDALVKFTATNAKKEKPVNPVGDLRGVGSEVDGLFAVATEAILDRVNCNVDDKGKKKPLSAGARSMRYARLLDIAAADLRQRGVQLVGKDPEDVARAWLKAGAEEEFRFQLGASDGSYQSPSDYPNILSAVSGKMMDIALATNTSTYRDWCYQLPAVPDFKPKTIVAIGGFSEIPLIEDGEEFTQSKRFEEASFIQADSYGDRVELTPVMIVNDDLGFFQENLADKITSLDLTLNRLCVNLVTGNVACVDGNDLFSSAHANVVTGGSGGAPSVAQVSTMRSLFRAQYDVGGQRKMRVGPRIALVGSAYETTSEQVFLPPPPDSPAFYTADSSINFFRNKIIPKLEQQIDDWSLGAYGWFLLADPALVRSIVYVHQTGFEGGKLMQWYDPRNRCRVTSIEGRFAAAVRNWRGIVRNSGGSGSL